MTTPVADRSSNKNEQIVHAAEVIGGSADRQAVFREIYTGKSRVKTVLDLMAKTRLERKRVLDAGRRLVTDELVNQLKVGGVTAYEKVPFFQTYRDRILAYATSRSKRAAVPTKRNPGGGARTPIKIEATLRIPKKRDRATLVTVDDIDSFSLVRRVPHGLDPVKMPETRFKNGVAAILGERAEFNDWGGELRDLSSSHLRIGGKRRVTAVAFKGPGKSGRLTPGKMGKNGDQIQRLARCPADVYLVQYWRDIDDSVLEQLQKLIQVKAYLEDRQLWYGIIDGDDSARLIQAYKKRFSTKSRKQRRGRKGQ